MSLIDLRLSSLALVLKVLCFNNMSSGPPAPIHLPVPDGGFRDMCPVESSLFSISLSLIIPYSHGLPYVIYSYCFTPTPHLDDHRVFRTVLVLYALTLLQALHLSPGL